MGKIIIIIVIIVGICGAIIYAKTGLKSSQKKDDPFPVLKGEYLGQKKTRPGTGSVCARYYLHQRI